MRPRVARQLRVPETGGEAALEGVMRRKPARVGSLVPPIIALKQDGVADGPPPPNQTPVEGVRPPSPSIGAGVKAAGAMARRQTATAVAGAAAGVGAAPRGAGEGA